jgi:hypothetical protein
MNKNHFIAYIENLRFTQKDPQRWGRSHPDKFSHWWIIIHAKNNTFTVCERDQEKCINIPFPENEADLQTFFNVIGI